MHIRNFVIQKGIQIRNEKRHKFQNRNQEEDLCGTYTRSNFSQNMPFVVSERHYNSLQILSITLH